MGNCISFIESYIRDGEPTDEKDSLIVRALTAAVSEPQRKEDASAETESPEDVISASIDGYEISVLACEHKMASLRDEALALRRAVAEGRKARGDLSVVRAVRDLKTGMATARKRLAMCTSTLSTLHQMRETMISAKESRETTATITSTIEMARRTLGRDDADRVARQVDNLQNAFDDMQDVKAQHDELARRVSEAASGPAFDRMYEDDPSAASAQGLFDLDAELGAIIGDAPALEPPMHAVPAPPKDAAEAAETAPPERDFASLLE